MNQSKAAMAAMKMIKGAQLSSKETFLYGRIETMIKVGGGSGIMSGSLFWFNDKPGFQTKWAESGIELLGRNYNTINAYMITTVGGKNFVSVEQTVLNQRTSDTFWKLCVDWNKERIIWKVNDIPVRTWVGNLNIPQKIMLNIWKSDRPNWAGNFNAGILPQQAEYKYIRFTPVTGSAWQEDFSTLDLSRWQIADWMIDGTQFVKENVSISGGNMAQRSETNLILKLT